MTMCEVCARPLNPHGARTGICARCRMDGAEFARSWMAELREHGATPAEIATVIGTTAHTVRARLRERAAACGEVLT